MLSIKNCEIFYTVSRKATDKDDLVDQISIDKDRKEYFLQENEDCNITDGYLPGGYEINSLYVSRLIFDIIVEGVKNAGFKEVIYVR